MASLANQYQLRSYLHAEFASNQCNIRHYMFQLKQSPLAIAELCRLCILISR
jgi:hypothetical protein